MRKIQFKTETGSVYEIDCDKLSVCRKETGPESGFVRADKTIPINYVPNVELGHTVTFMCPPYPGAKVGNELADGRAVVTSRVVEIVLDI